MQKRPKADHALTTRALLLVFCWSRPSAFSFATAALAETQNIGYLFCCYCSNVHTYSARIMHRVTRSVGTTAGVHEGHEAYEHVGSRLKRTAHPITRLSQVVEGKVQGRSSDCAGVVQMMVVEESVGNSGNVRVQTQKNDSSQGQTTLHEVSLTLPFGDDLGVSLLGWKAVHCTRCRENSGSSVLDDQVHHKVRSSTSMNYVFCEGESP